MIGRVLGVILLMLLTLPMVFNSCSAKHSASMSSSADLASENQCSLEKVFEDTYHKFLNRQCVTCHVSGGSGKGAFADDDVNTAWSAFSLVGYAKVSEYAVDAGHNSPFTGDANKEEIKRLDDTWILALAESERCRQNGESGSNRVVDYTSWIQFRSQGLNLSKEEPEVEVVFDLDSDIILSNADSSVIGFPGAKLSLKVIRSKNASGDEFYSVTEPVLSLTESSQDLRVKGIKLRLNGKVEETATTFDYVEESVRAGESRQLSAGSSVLTNVSDIDVLSLLIEEIEVVSLPPPPAPVRANFRIEKQVAPQERGVVTVWVELSEEVPSHTVIVNLKHNKDGLSGGTAQYIQTPGKTIINDDGDEVNINNFDWDYDLNVSTLVFLPRETSKKIEVKIAEDDRYEIVGSGDNQVNEKIKLEIGRVDGARRGSNYEHEIEIPDDDILPDPNSEIPTFTQLMSPGGVFHAECLKCHNSVDREGGYDITNYLEMVGNGVLIPGSPMESDMFSRMNENTPGIKTMPLDGLLPIYLRKQVELWIENGARNN